MAPAADDLHPIAVVAARTGLSTDVLRVWERRYQVVAPTRAPDGQRLYTDGDVERLRLLRMATEGGRTISQVARLSRDALIRMVESDSAARANRPDAGAGSGPDRIVAEGISRTRALDASGLEDLLRRSLAVLGVRTFIEEVAAPLLREIGEDWHAGTITPAHEHLASIVVQNLIFSAIHQLTPAGDAPRMVVATPAGERHAIGAALVAASAASEGWNAVYLGADLPAEDIATAARNTDARIVALSVIYAVDDGTIDEITRLRSLLPADVRILVGGAGARSLEGELAALGVTLSTSLSGFRQEASATPIKGRRRRRE